jgi:membrane protein
LQLSWIVCLFGASLAYASQNVGKFSFERDSKNISRRYKDFLTLLIVSLIAKRFAKGEKPYTADELSSNYRIPQGITSQLLYMLVETGVLIEVIYGDDERITHYQPAIDINQISVACVLTRVDAQGSENFKIDNKVCFLPQWKALLKTREDMLQANGNVLLKDL